MGRGPSATCRRGHPWTVESTVQRRNGSRTCRICLSEAEHERSLRDKPLVTSKTCTKCRVPSDAPYLTFAICSRNADGLQNWCKHCQARHALKVNYGLTLGDWMELLASQHYACAICGVRDPAADDPHYHDSDLITGDHTFFSFLHVDHDHACCPGKKSCGECVRGLLCGRCNRALGLMDDDLERLRRAVTYLAGPSG